MAFSSLLISCNDEPTQQPTQQPTENESTIPTVEPSVDEPIVQRPTYDYILEENENYKKVAVDVRTLNKINYSSLTIDGINSSIAVDPFSTAYLFGEASVAYPTAELLKNEVVLYTSAWYSQYTFERDEEVKEYVLYNDMGDWVIDQVSNTSKTFIPFNGAVLSIPSSVSFDLVEGDYISINGNIPTYDVGLYNQDGNRLAIRYINTAKWSDTGAHLYDNGYLSLVTNTAWSQIATINFAFDETTNTYYVDKFRNFDDEKRVYVNANNGFMVGASVGGHSENVALHEGVRFNLNDTIMVEEGCGIYDKSFTFKMNEENAHYLSDGTKVTFSVKKTNNALASTSRRWGLEVAVNKSNVIVEANDFASLPEGGYKLEFSGQGGTEYNIAYLIEEVFTKGSRVSISGSKLIINSTANQRIKNMHSLTSSYLEDVLNEVYTENYSYNVDKLLEIEKELQDFDLELDSTIYEENGTMQFRKFQIMNEINKLYFEIESATNRNEAAEVKTTWYIENYKTTDSKLESIKAHLDEIKIGGFNEIIVNFMENGAVNYEGSDYFPMISTVKGNNYGEYGKDYLKAITAEAHKRGIKVFGGFVPFTNGLERTFTELNDAFALSITGATSVSTSQGAVKMLDPANETVQQRIQDTIDDVLKHNPDLDGISLDYIRYGADNSYINTVMGVTESARIGFNQYSKDNSYSYNCANLAQFRNALKSDSTMFNRFNAYQQTLITNTVKNIKLVCKDYELPLTCAIADDYSYTKTWKCQDWADWANKGYVDALYLMDYYFGSHWINYYFEDMLKATKNKSLLVTGIDPSYANLTAEFYPKNVKGAIENPSSHGYGIFGTHTQAAKKDGWRLLKPSNWIDSISPFDSLDKTMKASADLLLERCDDIYIESKNQTTEEKELLKQDLETLLSLINGDNIKSCEAVMAQIDVMLEKTYASNSAQTRIKEQLKYMRKIAVCKLNIVNQ